jgi:hypothetical protein
MVTNMSQSWEERVQSLEALGADRSDAQAVVDAEDANAQPRVAETFGFSNSMRRFDDLQDKCRAMVSKIRVKHSSLSKEDILGNALAYLAMRYAEKKD